MRVSLLYMLILCLGTAAAATAQWTTSAAVSFSVTAPSGTKLFAGMSGGSNGEVLRSTDNGATWTGLRNGLPLKTASIGALFASGDSVFAATDSGIYFSSNAGDLWTSINGDLPANAIRANAIFVKGSSIFIAASIGGIYRSTNGGTNWTNLSSGIDAALKALYIFSAGNTLYIGANWYSNTTGWNTNVYRSTDNGSSWTDFSSGLPTNNRTMSRFVVVGNNILTATEKGIYRSSGGAAWTQVYASGASDLVNDGSTILTISGGKLRKSVDNGSSWTIVTPTPNYQMNTYLYPLQRGVAVQVVDGATALCVTTDQGTTLTKMGTKVNWPVPVFFTHNGRLFVGSTSYPYGAWTSDDSGATWHNTGITGSNPVNAFYAFGDSVYCGTGAGVWVSTDNGSTWSAYNASFGIVNINIYDFLSAGGSLYALTSDGLYRSMGNYWAKTLNVSYGGYYQTAVTLGDTIIVAGNTVSRSLDGGATWLEVTAGLTYGGSKPTVHKLVVHGHTLIAGTGSGVFTSTNGGSTWVRASAGIPDAASNITAVGVAGNGIVAGSIYNFGANPVRGTIWLSTNDGSTWTDIGAGLPSLATVVSFFYSNNVLFAGLQTNAAGIWARSLNGLVTGVHDGDAATQPSAFSLAQNYPNPFNPATSVSFTLESRAPVSLTVFDVLGRAVGEFVNGVLEQGAHTVTLDMNGYASGVYFYRLNVAGRVATRSMVLAR